MLTTQIANLFYVTLAFAALFAVSELLFRKFSWSGEQTRKLSHTLSGLFCLSFPWLFQDLGYIYLLGGGFMLFLHITERKGWMPSIHQVSRQTRGALLFPLAVMCCFTAAHFMYNDRFFFVPLLLLALADAAACLVGQKWPLRTFKVRGSEKSWGGSLTFLGIALVISSIGLWNVFYYPIFSILSVALAATLAEAVSIKGWDNITIPITALWVMYLLYFPGILFA